MDILTVCTAFVFVVASLSYLVVSLMDLIKKKKSPAPAQNPPLILEEQKKHKEEMETLVRQLHEARAALQEQERSAGEKYAKDLEKLKEECELFKKDSFEARLEAQNVHKELASQRAAHKVLSIEYQALKEQKAALENVQNQAKGEAQDLANDFQKAKEGLEEQYRRSLDDCEKIKKEYEEFRNNAAMAQEAIEKKYQDVGFHKVAFEQLSQEHELLRRQFVGLQEVHKNDLATVEDLSKKLESANQTLAAQEEAQKDTEKLEELLEKQIAVQKKRAAELVQLEQENKALKEQLEVLKKEKNAD